MIQWKWIFPRKTLLLYTILSPKILPPSIPKIMIDWVSIVRHSRRRFSNYVGARAPLRIKKRRRTPTASPTNDRAQYSCCCTHVRKPNITINPRKYQILPSRNYTALCTHPHWYSSINEIILNLPQNYSFCLFMQNWFISSICFFSGSSSNFVYGLTQQLARFIWEDSVNKILGRDVLVGIISNQALHIFWDTILFN